MGNQKPKSLKGTENALWLFLFSLASGADYKEGMSKFLASVDEIDLQTEENVDVDWFVKGSRFSMLVRFSLNLYGTVIQPPVIAPAKKRPTIEEVEDEDDSRKVKHLHQEENDTHAGGASEEEGDEVKGSSKSSDDNTSEEPDIDSEVDSGDHPDQDARMSDSDGDTTTNSEIKAAEEAKMKAIAVSKMNAVKKRVREREKKARERERRARELENLEAIDAAIKLAKKKVEEEKKRKKAKATKDTPWSRPPRVPDLPNIPAKIEPLPKGPKMPGMANLKPVKASSEGVKVRMFTVDPNRDAFKYDFKVPDSIVRPAI